MQACALLRTALCAVAIWTLAVAGSRGQENSNSSGAQGSPSASGSTGAVTTPAASSASASKSLLDLNLDQLSKTDVVVPTMSTPVTTVSREPSTVGRSPAAVFVITPEMIARSGATTVPDVLRMVPGLDVAKVDSSTWAISSRGFNNRFADKLLVQVDRRVVYDPLFNGVFWDVQDLVLQDVERIEVVRGPGATVWGSNAVNGVINIITKRAKDTQGAMVSGLGGNQERGTTNVQYGGKVGNDLYWRGYGKQFERGPGVDLFTGQLGPDAWRQQRGGYRADWTPTEEDLITTQGDIYSGHAGEAFPQAFPNPGFVANHSAERGGNTLLRWGHTNDDDSNWQLQSYFDRTLRHDPLQLGYDRWTFDLDFQYNFHWREWHRIVTGCGYRSSWDKIYPSATEAVVPNAKQLEWTNYFIQDEMTLVDDRLFFTAGTKFEYTTFANLQVQPSLRLLYQPSPRASCWMAVSRAARSPSRIENGFVFNQQVFSPPPTFFSLFGNPNLKPENLVAYELGYRAQPTDDFSYDLALFYNQYSNLIGAQALPPVFIPPNLILPSVYANNLHGDSFGTELATTWQVNEGWRLYGAYTLLFAHVTGSDPFNAALQQGSAPTNQYYLQSSWNFGKNVQCDLIGRFVGPIRTYGVPAYAALDARVNWQVNKNLTIAIVGQNLSEGNHLEYTDPLGGLMATQVPRTAYGMMTYSY